MVNNTVNGKKTGIAAGIDDTDTVLTCIDFKQKVQKNKNELNEEWELEAKGKLHRAVMESLKSKMNLSEQENYIKIRAYVNTIKDLENRGISSKEAKGVEEEK